MIALLYRFNLECHYFCSEMENVQLRAENKELKRQNEYLRNKLMEERRLFVNEKDELDAKIIQLEEMNDEMISKDYDVGQLEHEISRVNDLLKMSKSRESELEKELLLSSFGKFKWSMITFTNLDYSNERIIFST